MAVVTDALSPQPGLRTFGASLDIESTPADAFALLCSVEKWPVWLSLLRSVTATNPNAPLGLGSDVIVRSSLPGEPEQLFEVDQFIANYHLSLVGAYSVRRRLDFRIEARTTRSKLHMKVTYPAYGGRLGEFLDRWKHGRKLSAAVSEALVHFKGLVEYRTDDGRLTDF